VAGHRVLRDIKFQELSEVKRQSGERLRPLGEPLEYDWGLNRWLAGAREEAYSDWLAWLLAKMTLEELACVLGVPQLRDLGLDPRSCPDRVDREFRVEYGQEGRWGRLDILVRLQDRAVVVIELKRGSVDDAYTEKQTDYVDAIEREPEFRGKSKFYIILVTTADRDEVDGFEVRRYPVLCRNLRRLAELWKHEKLLLAATTLMVAASIESNLLRMSLKKNSFTPRTVFHLSRYNEWSDYE
jgi:hypothetical protein